MYRAPSRPRPTSVPSPANLNLEPGTYHEPVAGDVEPAPPASQDLFPEDLFAESETQFSIPTAGQPTHSHPPQLSPQVGTFTVTQPTHSPASPHEFSYIHLAPAAQTPSQPQAGPNRTHPQPQAGPSRTHPQPQTGPSRTHPQPSTAHPQRVPLQTTGRKRRNGDDIEDMLREELTRGREASSSSNHAFGCLVAAELSARDPTTCKRLRGQIFDLLQ